MRAALCTSIIAVLLTAGCSTAAAAPAPTPISATFAAPGEIDGLPLVTPQDDATALAAKIGPPSAPFAAAYRKGAESIEFAAAAGPVADPAGLLDAYLTTEVKSLADVGPVEPGRYGGVARCGRGATTTMCWWADPGSFGRVTFTADRRDDFARLRELVQRGERHPPIAGPSPGRREATKDELGSPIDIRWQTAWLSVNIDGEWLCQDCAGDGATSQGRFGVVKLKKLKGLIDARLALETGTQQGHPPSPCPGGVTTVTTFRTGDISWTTCAGSTVPPQTMAILTFLTEETTVRLHLPPA